MKFSLWPLYEICRFLSNFRRNPRTGSLFKTNKSNGIGVLRAALDFIVFLMTFTHKL